MSSPGLGQDPAFGTLNSAPFGTDLPPTDQTFFEAELDAAYVDAGLIGKAGVTIQQGRSFTDIEDMDGNAIDTLQTASNGMFKTNLMELSVGNLRNLFGDDNVTFTDSTDSAGNRTVIAASLGEDLEARTCVFMLKKGRKRVGAIVPQGRFIDPGDIPFQADRAADVDVSIKCVPVWDAGRGKMVDFYLFLDDGVFAVSLVPTIASVSPTAQVAGEAVAIVGNRFTGTTGAASVKFGATNATSYEVVSRRADRRGRARRFRRLGPRHRHQRLGHLGCEELHPRSLTPTPGAAHSMRGRTAAPGPYLPHPPRTRKGDHHGRCTHRSQEAVRAAPVRRGLRLHRTQRQASHAAPHG